MKNGEFVLQSIAPRGGYPVGGVHGMTTAHRGCRWGSEGVESAGEGRGTSAAEKSKDK